MGDSYHFRLKELGNVTDRHLTMAQQINNAKTDWLAQGLELIGTRLGLEGIVFHGIHRRVREEGCIGLFCMIDRAGDEGNCQSDAQKA